jgi:phospholipid/cholesterol/gamma-HCH transport system ATP-binding protein
LAQAKGISLRKGAKMDALALRPLATAAPPTAQSSVPIAEMHDLSVRWGSRTILNGVNLSIEPGEQLVVVGPSGAGKSTVLRLLAGLLLPSSGRLNLNGEAQTYLRLDQQEPPDVRLVFQNPALLGSLSVKENVGFLLYRDGRLSEREITDRVNQALEAVGLLGIADQMPSELSGGMQKRVSFARVLIQDPRKTNDQTPLLLFDEPTAGLDPVACTRIEDLIVRTTDVAQAGSVVVSHVHSTIERTAEQVVLLYDGAFRWNGSIDDYRTTTNPYVVQFRSGSLNGPMQPAEL